ncbi:MAG: hypothetical protein MI741_22285, partial [Rhodospirillales bacterium]|nr:hypothetical protein [Rhodospirillales bacterium]
MQSSSKAFLFVTVELDIAADSILNSTIFTLVYFIKADDQAGGAVNRLTSRNGFNFETAIGNL